MLIAQLSDPHVRPAARPFGEHLDTAVCLERAVTRLLALRPAPDVVIVTGDLVDFGTAEEYVRCREALGRISQPLFLLPGNHDDRAELRAAFPGHRYLAEGAYLHYVVDGWPVRLICLDTVEPGRPGGALGPERLAWLAARLAEAPSQPTIVAMHHPPFLVGIGFMDRIALADGEEFAAVIARHPQVQAVVSGHVHRTVVTRVGGTVAMIAPATAHQIPLDLAGGGPESYVLEPPGFLLHRWDGHRLASHTVYVEGYPGPFRFGQD
jgi:3',5'-cyclic AMP phosphodiesterase CpdA